MGQLLLLTNISGDIPKLKDSKIYNFPQTRIEEKRIWLNQLKQKLSAFSKTLKLLVDLTQCKLKLKMTEF